MGAGCPELDIDARGVIFGLNQNHTKAHLIRAIMESIAYMLRRNIELLENLNVKTKEIISLGGGSRSKTWKEIKADVTQRTVITPRCEESACLGVAILSGKAAGLFKTVQEGVDSMVSMKERQEPQLLNQETYSRLFSIYIELYEKLSPVFKKVNRITSNTSARAY
jgi:xylulokinase